MSSAILSAEDLNDFISPGAGVACIKPVETLPPDPDSGNPYEVTTEDKVQHANAPPASISLTDCLACSGCVTSAEAVLISLQSHTEVLSTLDSFPSIDPRHILKAHNGYLNGYQPTVNSGKVFVASVSPQVRASLAATYGISEKQAGNLIDQFLRGPGGLRAGGQHNSGFTYVVDTNNMREACHVLGADEVATSMQTSGSPSRPVLTSACPGWICYVEKTHPHVLPHLSKLKSPQALTGTLLKSVLSKALNLHPSQIWHLALMPCFDKKLEASREELTDRWWQKDVLVDEQYPPVRDVDCVITTRELLTLANERGIALHDLPLTPVSQSEVAPFPDPLLEKFLFSRRSQSTQTEDSSTSGGYMYHILKTQQALHPGSTITIQRGRNADVADYMLISSTGEQLMKCGRFYGFRNIQNLVRKLKPTRTSRLPGAARRMNKASSAASADDYTYVEVMACPGGCTSGGGQIKFDDVKEMSTSGLQRQGEKPVPQVQKDWLREVDETYFSASSDSDEDTENEDTEMKDASESEDHIINGISVSRVQNVLQRWSQYMDIPVDKLVYTTYREVKSDVGKNKSAGAVEHVAGLASSIGGGW